MNVAIALRLTKSQNVATRLQHQYDDLKDPVKRAQRIAEYETLAALSKDPGYMDKMMKAEQQIAAGLVTLLGPISDAGKEVIAIDRELATARAALAALTAGDREAPACYANKDTTSLSRFRRDPGGNCVAIVRPNWKLFNPALPRSAPQILTNRAFRAVLRCRAARPPRGRVPCEQEVAREDRSASHSRVVAVRHERGSIRAWSWQRPPDAQGRSRRQRTGLTA